MEQLQNNKYNKPTVWLIIIAVCLLLATLILSNVLDLKSLFSSASTNNSINIPLPMPQGEISATDCTIASGASTCVSLVTWLVEYPTNGATTSLIRDNPTNTQVSNNLSGTNVSNTVNFGISTFFLHHNNVELQKTSINANCAPSTNWNGTACAVIGDTDPVTVTTPIISPNGGSFSSSRSVSLSTVNREASIRYTTNGSTPSSSLGTIYSSPFTISRTTTVKAIAYQSGFLDSSVVSATFTKTSSSGSGGGGSSSGTTSSSSYIGCEGRNTGFSTVTGRSCFGNVVVSIPGCEGRNTGFSSINGQSCIGNYITVTHYNFGTITLRNGSVGEAVKELQRFLNAKLNLGLVVDGRLGPKTIAVIKVWQLNHGLVPDGLVGPKTKAAMNSGL